MKNKILAILLSIAIMLSLCGSVYAADGEKSSETVYVLLDTTGATRDIIVKGDGINQKSVEGELPFHIKLTYLLDNTQAAPQDILGKSGAVKITIDISPSSNAKTYYKDNLALQMQFPIDMSDGFATDIKAEGLTGVTVGAVKTLSGIVLPGKSAKYEISYQTQKFEMQSVNFVCMPFDLTGMADIDISAVGGQITDLQDGIGNYVEGVSKVSDSLSQVNAGMTELAASGTTLAGGYTQTTAGENALIAAMLATMPPEQQKAFEPQIQAIQAAQKQFTQNVNAYTGGISQASIGLNQIATGTKELAQSGVTLKDGINSAISPLLNMSNQPTVVSEPESFISSDKVSEIQFVMKTDPLTAAPQKEDVTPAPKAKETFWNRLVHLFIK